jgi:hypothetical protein
VILTHQSKYLPSSGIQLIFYSTPKFQATYIHFSIYFSPLPNEKENYLMWSGHWWKKWHKNTISFSIFNLNSCHKTSLFKWNQQQLSIHMNMGDGWSGVKAYNMLLNPFEPSILIIYFLFLASLSPHLHYCNHYNNCHHRASISCSF